MAKGIYVGVGGVAKKVKKVFVGIGGAVKKVKKVFVGVGGVPKLAYSSAEFTRFGTASLAQNKSMVGATANANYVIFAGGGDNSKGYANAEAFNISLVKTTATALSSTAINQNGGTVGNYGLLFGGTPYNSPNAGVGNVFAYNTSLVQTSPSLATARTATSSGLTIPGYACLLNIQASLYNASLVKSDMKYLLGVEEKGIVSSAIVGNYILSHAQQVSHVYVYDTSFVSHGTVNLSAAKNAEIGASNDNYALFAGGSYSLSVDAFNKSLVKTSAPSLIHGAGWTHRGGPVGISTNEYAVFAGGSYANNVDMYDNSLVKSAATNLAAGVMGGSGASNSRMAMFGGGRNGSGSTNFTNHVTAYSLE